MKSLRALARRAAPYTASVTAAAALVVATPALAQTAPAGADYSSLTSAVNFGSVITALLAVAAVVMGVLIVRKGIGFIKRSL